MVSVSELVVSFAGFHLGNAHFVLSARWETLRALGDKSGERLNWRAMRPDQTVALTRYDGLQHSLNFA